MNSVEELQGPSAKNDSNFRSRARGLWLKIVIALSPVREFLEASTLHGLVYISKAESLWGKILWTVSVIVSFSISGVLIHQSFADWSEHPVSSVISTHPIMDLKFPNVTVCPPKGTNTALNYDLVKLDKSFTMLQQEAIHRVINKTFFERETTNYVKTTLEIVNEENLINIYNGFQALPTQINDTGYTVRLSGQSGEIVSHPSAAYNLSLIHI